MLPQLQQARELQLLRLPRWMAEWIAEQCAEGPPYKTATQLIEAAMVKAHALRPPKESDRDGLTTL